MPLHDLTPQLRTRLSRLERVVGWFVTFAFLLLLVGLGYYVYELAERKGWFLTKMPYFTFVKNAYGVNVGDRVKLMGFDAGRIVHITAEQPGSYFDVFIQFEINEPYYGYLWEDSRARIGAADFLGNRFIEVTKGDSGTPTYAMHEIVSVPLSQAMNLVGGTNNYIFGRDFQEPGTTNVLVRASEYLSREALQKISNAGFNQVLLVNNNSAEANPPKFIWDDKQRKYVSFTKTKGYWLRSEESPALTERLEQVVSTVEAALPDFLALTNKLSQVLTRADTIAAHADELLVSAKPIMTNAALISENLRNPKGSLGDWLIPTNINQELQSTLSKADLTMASAQTNLNALSLGVLSNLNNVAGITGSLRSQVESSPWIVPQLSDLILHADEFVQGLKQFWLLRSAFDDRPAPPPTSTVQPRIGDLPE